MHIDTLASNREAQAQSPCWEGRQDSGIPSLRGPTWLVRASAGEICVDEISMVSGSGKFGRLVESGPASAPRTSAPAGGARPWRLVHAPDARTHFGRWEQTKVASPLVSFPEGV